MARRLVEQVEAGAVGFKCHEDWGTTPAVLRSALTVADETCVELGHALGNQHWPALVKGTCVYVPLTVDRKVMSSVMKTHRFEGIQYSFVPGSEIVPYLAPHESRRLFGAAEGAVHTHSPDSSHHSHDDSPSHRHSANHDHHHGHGHGHG